jgi:RNA polymerase sigma factor for flagellar operon FliA
MEAAEKSEEKLWTRYKNNGDKAAKEELILKYVPLVKHIVGKITVQIPDKFEYEDLVNYGVLGLIDALDRFDPERGVKFSTYAVPRIKGAIYDELRKIDWVPTQVRRKAKKLSRAMQSLEGRLGRSPTDKEFRQELDLDKDKFRDLLAEVNIPENVSLERIISPQSGDNLKLKDIIQGSQDQEPDNVYAYQEMMEVLGTAIDKLGDKEKIVVSLYYYEDLTLQEIGEVLELTTARISQIHTKAIFRLRGYLSQKKDQLVD